MLVIICWTLLACVINLILFDWWLLTRVSRVPFLASYDTHDSEKYPFFVWEVLVLLVSTTIHCS
jgi:hypothetical protein